MKNNSYFRYMFFGAIMTVLLGSFFAFSSGQGGKNVVYDYDVDSLVTSSSLDTVTFDLGSYYTPRSYEIQISADSVTGATGATCYVEYSASYESTDWVSIDNAVVNGVTTRSYEDGTIAGGRIRCRCLAPSSTQKTYVRVAAQFAPRVIN